MVSQYIDCISPILYGRYGNYPNQTFGGRRHSHYPIGHHSAHSTHPLHTKYKHGGNSAPQFWDYPNPTSKLNLMQTQYGGRRRVIKRGGSNNVLPLPPCYLSHSAYEVGNDYVGGLSQSLNTYIGGRKRRTRRGKNISQKKAYVSYNNYY